MEIYGNPRITATSAPPTLEPKTQKYQHISTSMYNS